MLAYVVLFVMLVFSAVLSSLASYEIQDSKVCYSDSKGKKAWNYTLSMAVINSVAAVGVIAFLANSMRA